MSTGENPSVIIRKMEKEDCTIVRALIQELADYEKMPDGPKITADTLLEDGFNTENPYYHALVAVKGVELIGFSLFFYTYSTWEGKSVYMEDLYVQPAHRGQGVGTKLWKGVVAEALQLNCSRCNFSVLDWNLPSIEFYKSKGAVDLSALEGWKAFRLHRAEMEKIVKE